MGMKNKVLLFAGTRPEAIKLAPVVYALRNEPEIELHLCATGQHKEMLFQAFSDFDLRPDSDLGVMRSNQTLAGLSARLFEAIDAQLERLKPDVVLVQGDTTTVEVAATCAFYRKIRIGHVEAGLRSHNMLLPFPEEFNRRVTGLIASWHFAPTSMAMENLLREGVARESIFVTGNTVIDALLWMVDKVRHCPPPITPEVETSISSDRRMILVTSHRRENLGASFEDICAALLRLARTRRDIDIVFPTHLNPLVCERARSFLAGEPNIILINPLSYAPFIYLMDKCAIILSDSGGIQEEGPSLGKPVLIMRDVTERPEGVESGVNELVGTDPDRIVQSVEKWLARIEDDVPFAKNPYGDGHAAARIASIVAGDLRA